MSTMNGTLSLFERLKQAFSHDTAHESINYDDATTRTVMPDIDNTANDAPLTPEEEEEMVFSRPDIIFAETFCAAGGKLIYCENLKHFVEELQALKTERGWHHIYSWEAALNEYFIKENFQMDTLDVDMKHSEAALSLCHNAIAEFGGILLNPSQASQRRFHLFPKTHLIFISVDQLKNALSEAVDDFKQQFPDDLPSLIDLDNAFSNNKSGSDTLILNAIGTKDIFVFLCDEPLG